MIEELRSQLEEAIKYYGTGDIVTIMLSQKLDKLIVEGERNKWEEH